VPPPLPRALHRLLARQARILPAVPARHLNWSPADGQARLQASCLPAVPARYLNWPPAVVSLDLPAAVEDRVC
jgi:hypothetical protein